MNGWFKPSACGDRVLLEELERNSSIDATSYYSLSNGILPSLGNRSNRRVILRRFIVSPLDRRYRYFQCLLCFVSGCLILAFSVLDCNLGICMLKWVC